MLRWDYWREGLEIPAFTMERDGNLLHSSPVVAIERDHGVLLTIVFL